MSAGVTLARSQRSKFELGGAGEIARLAPGGMGEPVARSPGMSGCSSGLGRRVHCLEGGWGRHSPDDSHLNPHPGRGIRGQGEPEIVAH